MNKENQTFTLHKILTTNKMVGMDMTIITIRFDPPSSANFVDAGGRGGIPHNKGGHFSFCKSQLDSRMSGVGGPTGLWTYYHSKLLFGLI
jgi:hypothetical protein